VDTIGGIVSDNGIERTFINDTWLKGESLHNGVVTA
jgi:hypothetical protein